MVPAKAPIDRHTIRLRSGHGEIGGQLFPAGLGSLLKLELHKQGCTVGNQEAIMITNPPSSSDACLMARHQQASSLEDGQHCYKRESYNNRLLGHRSLRRLRAHVVAVRSASWHTLTL